MSAPRTPIAVADQLYAAPVAGLMFGLVPALNDCVQSVLTIVLVAIGSNSTCVFGPFVVSHTPCAAATRWLGSVGSIATGEVKVRPGGPVLDTAPGWISVIV